MTQVDPTGPRVVGRAYSNVEAERAVVSEVLMDPALLDAEGVRWLIPGDFEDESCRLLFAAIRDLAVTGKLAAAEHSAVAVAEELTRRGQYGRAGEEEGLITVIKAGTHPENHELHLSIVCRNAVFRAAMAGVSRALERAFLQGKDPLHGVVGAVYSLIELAARCGQYLDLLDLESCDYGLYLKTEHWKRVREQALARSDNRCAVCNAPDRIDVHHRTYERRGREQPGDVIALCRTCHRLFHENGRLARPPGEASGA